MNTLLDKLITDAIISQTPKSLQDVKNLDLSEDETSYAVDILKDLDLFQEGAKSVE